MAHAQSSRLFEPSFPQQPVSMLILVENSQAMSYIWEDLKSYYLDPVVDRLQTATQMCAPITVSVLESYPSQEPGTNVSLPRQYTDCHEGLRDIKFNFSPENKISAGRINSGIDFLDTMKYQGQSPALHLIIVSATSPSDDDTGTGVSGNSYSPWAFLAQKMAEKHIHCHIVVSPDNETGSLTKLFEETLRLQEFKEESFYPSTSPSRMLFKLSVKSSFEHYSDPAPSNPYPPQHLVAPRRNSYPPLDNFHSESFDELGASVPGDADPSPTLVSQLQQVHGLTKKKVYGAKPTRQPFIRDERVKYRKPPTPLTMTIPDPMITVAAGGRAMSQSRVDRMARVGQSSPTDLHSRRQHHWPPRRGSRLSTPEPENLTWSASPAAYHDTSPGGSYVPSDLSSPVTPVTTTLDDIYSLPTNIASGPPPSIPSVSSSVAAYQIGGMPESNWSQQQQQQQPQHPQYPGSYHPATSYFAPPSVPQFFSANGDLLSESQGSVPPQRTPPSTPGSYNPYPTPSPPSAAPSQGGPMIVSNAPPAGHPVVPSMPVDATLASYAKARAEAPKKPVPVEDEERFVFGQDFVAATATLFEEEVLPAYPNYPGMSSGLSTSGMQASLLSSSPAQAGELYASRVRRNYPLPSSASVSNNSMSNSSGYALSSNGISSRGSYTGYHPPAYVPTYGSSLTGWAG